MHIYSCSEIITFNRIETVGIKKVYLHLWASFLLVFTVTLLSPLPALSLAVRIPSYIQSGADRETAKVKVILILLTKSYFKCNKSLKLWSPGNYYEFAFLTVTTKLHEYSYQINEKDVCPCHFISCTFVLSQSDSLSVFLTLLKFKRCYVELKGWWVCSRFPSVPEKNSNLRRLLFPWISTWRR